MSAPRPEEKGPTAISLEAGPQCSATKSAAKSVPECPPAPVNQNRTWSSLFTSAKLPERVNLKYEEALFSDGMLQLRGSPEEVEEGAAYWRNSLVGHFIGRRPTFLTLQTRVQSMWKPTGSMEVLSLPSGFFIFRFGLSDDRDRILEGGPWFVQNKLLLLKAWTPDTKLEKPDLTTVPIWVKIYNLPLCLWTPSFIGRIASSLGQPLYTDQQTASRTRVGYARVCIEVSSQQQLPDHIRFCFNGAQVYTLNLEYDWKPTRCSHCCTFGHTPASCPRQPQVQKKAWVPTKEPRTGPPSGVTTHRVDTPSQQQPPVQAEPLQGVGTSTRDTVIDQPHRKEGGLSIKQVEQQNGRKLPAKPGTTSNPPVKLTAREKGKSVVVEGMNHISTKNIFDCLIALGDVDAPVEPTPNEGQEPPPPKPPANV